MVKTRKDKIDPDRQAEVIYLADALREKGFAVTFIAEGAGFAWPESLYNVRKGVTNIGYEKLAKLRTFAASKGIPPYGATAAQKEDAFEAPPTDPKKPIAFSSVLQAVDASAKHIDEATSILSYALTTCVPLLRPGLQKIISDLTATRKQLSV